MKFSNETTSTPNLQREYLHRGETVLVQFLQSAGTGLIFGIAALVIGYWARWRTPWMISLIAGILALGVTWMILQRNWVSMTTFERLTGLDINRDGVVGEPAQEPVRSIRVQVDRVNEQGHVTESSFFDLPASSDQMVSLADGLLNSGMRFSVREWCGLGRPFSVAEFSILRSEMLKRGMIRQLSDKDSRVGYELTGEGRKVLQGILSE